MHTKKIFFFCKNAQTRRQKSENMDTNRLSKELREIASDKASGVSVELVDGDSLAHMRGTITGASCVSLLLLLLLLPRD
jgi:hypothetical protein